jgi:hypothetical protein
MEPLIIEGTKNTPEIKFDIKTGKFSIIGNSIPEDVLSFYTPIFRWLEDYISNPCPLTDLSIKLSYFNSASSKTLLDILNMLEAVNDTSAKVFVKWHYHDLDEDMLQTGKEFESMLSIPFEFIAYYQD